MRERQFHGLAAQIDDVSAGAHERNRCTGAQDRSREIGRNDLEDLLVGRLGDQEGLVHGGIVDEHVDPRVARRNRFERRRDRLRRSDVAADGHGARTDLRRQLLDFRRRAPQQHDVVAVGRKAPRQRAPEPRARPRDDNGFRHEP